MTAEPIAAFAFSAQSPAGESVTGSINAANVTEANRKLSDLQLRAIELDPLRAQPQKPRRLSGDDFQAFNTQLAYLSTAGLPIEKSLRLIAEDMRSGALAQTVRQVATDLESGQSLPEAFAQHSKQFPPLYSELVNAGIRTGNLSGMLLGLGRHLEMVRRLRATLWRATSYPLMVVISLLLVISFLGIFVFPQFKVIFGDFKVELPLITQAVMGLSDILVNDWPFLLGGLIAIVIGPPILIRSIPNPLLQQHIRELLLVPIPVIGPAIKRNLLARWCDALKLGIEAGVDLPTAITLAGQSVGSPRLINDGQILVETLNAGQPLDDRIKTRWLPPTVMVVLSMAASSNDLPAGLDTLSAMFQQQAEIKMSMIPTVLMPVLILLLGCVIALVVLAMFAPMIALVSSVSGPQKN